MSAYSRDALRVFRDTGRVFIVLIICQFCMLSASGQSGTVELTGEQKKWHPITLTLEGPSTSETADPNPFLDFRFNVTFSKGSKSILVPGYFAADGNAANSSATSGNKWRARFVPDETGMWTYKISFRTGDNVAIDDSPTAGQPNAFDGISSTFFVGDTDKTGKDFRGRGILRQAGEHYLLFDSGEWFITSGAGSPETFLAYSGFDNTFSTGSWIPKSYATHINDWKTGDPTWGSSKGKGIIGAINYLSDVGVNGLFMLVMNSQGDGKDTFPWIAHEDFYHFDVSKLAQWEIVLDHMNRKGIMPQLVLQEMDIEQLLDGGELGVTRKTFYREMMARFNHLNGVTWNIGEEHRKSELGGNTTAQRLDFVNYLAELEPYGHPVVMHTSAGEDNYNALYGPLLGHPKFGGMSYHIHGLFETNIDTGGGLNTYKYARAWRENSANGGRRWTITLDECCGWNTGVRPDQSNLVAVRKDEMWGMLMAGGSGFNWYLGFDVDFRDLTLEDFRRYDFLWETSTIATDFFLNHLPFVDMNPVDGLTPVDSIRVFAKQGEVYAVYLRDGGTTTLDLKGYDETFNVSWYNPRTGGALFAGSVAQVTGPGVKALGGPPFDAEQDWVALVRTGEVVNTLTARFAASAADQSFVMDFDASTSTSTGTTIVSYGWDFGEGSTGAGRQTSHTYATPGFYTVTLTITDSQGSNAGQAQTIEVKHPSATGAFFEKEGLLVIEAENFEKATPRSGQAWILDRESEGYEGSGSMAVLPDIGGFYGKTYSAFSPEMSFQADFSTMGTYYVWLRVRAINLDGNSVHVGLDGQEKTSTEALETNVFDQWVWLRTRKSDGGIAVMQINTAGEHFINLWAREDGLYVDRLLLTTNAGFVPTGSGPPQSLRAGEIPTAAITAIPVSGLAPLSVSFDASGSTAPLGHTITYAWALGDDATQAGETVNYTYVTSGTYTVTLSVEASNGNTDTAMLDIIVLPSDPVASFTATPASGQEPLTVLFDASVTTTPAGISIDDFNWEFGDGETGVGETISYLYAQSGTYPVILTVEASNGKKDADTLSVQVLPANPVASFDATPASGMAPLFVEFDGSTSTAPEGIAITDYNWDFGDGASGAGITASHTFEAPGDFLVTLSVVDANGNSDTDTAFVNVTPRPESHEIHVSEISIEVIQGAGLMYYGQARVSIVDEHNLPVAGVIVTGIFSGNVTGESSGNTDAAGVAILGSDVVNTSPEVINFCLNDVNYTSLIYKPEANNDPGFACLPNTVGAQDESILPEDYAIDNYPDPFRGTTTILLDLPKPGRVSLAVYNMLGQEVAHLLEGNKEAGSHRIIFKAEGLSDGVYLYTLETESFRMSKMMVIR